MRWSREHLISLGRLGCRLQTNGVEFHATGYLKYRWYKWGSRVDLRQYPGALQKSHGTYRFAVLQNVPVGFYHIASSGTIGEDVAHIPHGSYTFHMTCCYELYFLCPRVRVSGIVVYEPRCRMLCWSPGLLGLFGVCCHKAELWFRVCLSVGFHRIDSFWNHVVNPVGCYAVQGGSLHDEIWYVQGFYRILR